MPCDCSPDMDTSALWAGAPHGSGNPDGLCAPVGTEEDCLELIGRYFPQGSAHAPLARVHDCAELAGLPAELALSTDMFLEDVHFRRRYFRPEEAGAKALNRALSDLAAAGAVPLGFSLALMLPRDFGRQPLQGLLQGMAEAAARAGVALVGGDLCRASVLGCTITVWGRASGPGLSFLRRGQALPGDILFLGGEAGLARAGFLDLERYGRQGSAERPLARAAQLAPPLLLEQGRNLALLRARLAAEGLPARFSQMDLSDGLARDLPRLLGPYGVDLDFPDSLIHAEVVSAAGEAGLSAEDFFLLGGEDYALVGTCPPECWALLQREAPALRRLGKVRAEAGLYRHGRRKLLSGFDHFAPSAQGDRPPRPDLDAAAPMGREEAVAAMISLGRETWQSGLMAGFNGNISCRIRYDGKRPGDCAVRAREQACLITRSGAAKARLCAQDCVCLDIEDGAGLDGAHAPAASSESGLHLEIYRNCPQSAAVLHTHPPHLLALSLRLAPEQRLSLPLPEADNYRRLLSCTPFYPPGSAELARAAGEAARRAPAIWLERHGLVVHGTDLRYALSLTEELEQLARVQLALLQ
ncbi:class II aldolase/adducin family protein [Desulfovibrio sp. OttesenSCG-928-A18]|nr:class II aldolase/adducin family protein [Desulfovibrio sp. OttesenSCG-928-A18]